MHGPLLKSPPNAGLSHRWGELAIRRECVVVDTACPNWSLRPVLLGRLKNYQFSALLFKVIKYLFST